MTVSAETTFCSTDNETQTVIRFSEADKFVEIQQSLLTGKSKGRAVKISPHNMTTQEAMTFVESLTEAVSFVFPILEDAAKAEEGD